MKKAFTRRRYRHPGQFLGDQLYLVRHARTCWRLSHGRGIAPAFRERLMLAVTQVNGCRYCSFAHSRRALKEGLSQREIEALLQGSLDDVPEAERTAVLYAQHWAETEGHPDPQAHERLIGEYGAEMAAYITAALRTIRMGNLTGNTLDWLLWRLSFGRLGAA
ncbi:MAG TPA: carboxymuconolactone decarboxylase family protein [Candidatus Hydrogenedentes bacterium]|nr:carboxymuconolactone decarboxylase family protein [Candidatus Hydrogenedentota bacterium]